LREENRSRQSKEGEENLLTKMEPIKRWDILTKTGLEDSKK
jgi:hypothetical protein